MTDDPASTPREPRIPRRPNRRIAIEDAIDADPVAACVRELMAERSSWAGNATDRCGPAPITAGTELGGSAPAGPEIPGRSPAACGRVS
jgi:hypothetical protein